MKKTAVIVFLLVLSLAATNVFAKNRNVKVNNRAEKQVETPSWTVQTVTIGTDGVATITLKAKDDVKLLKTSTMTEVMIDGVAKKPEDITVGMKSISYVVEGCDSQISRIDLASADPNTKSKTKGKGKGKNKGK